MIELVVVGILVVIVAVRWALRSREEVVPEAQRVLALDWVRNHPPDRGRVARMGYSKAYREHVEAEYPGGWEQLARDMMGES